VRIGEVTGVVRCQGSIGAVWIGHALFDIVSAASAEVSTSTAEGGITPRQATARFGSAVEPRPGGTDERLRAAPRSVPAKAPPPWSTPGAPWARCTFDRPQKTGSASSPTRSPPKPAPASTMSSSTMWRPEPSVFEYSERTNA
jgi:hypothetical protein